MNRTPRIAALLVAGLLASVVQAQYRSDRPIRGAWLRPPSTVAALEPYLQSMARAGLTDLYLETFYWGVSTGKQGVFNSRFGYDYLAQAIPLAARYNIRMHAWIEAGYWQYGSTGGYNFTANPEWRVISRATSAIGGDQASQVFANLCHPGVQAKLRSYATELAGYDGLWDVQTDYHRFPIDDNTSDSYTAPWTYDTWTESAFRTYTGNATLSLSSQASQSGQTYWNSFLTWRRNGVSEAARQLYLGVADGSPDVTFSASVFPAAASNSAQLSKCQDWTTWCSGNYLDMAIPMCYSSTTTSINSEISTAVSLAVGKRVIPGLAFGTGHPAILDQMNTCKARGIEDFVIFEASLINSASESTISSWITSSTKPMRADLNGNGVLDMGDYSLFMGTYSGTSVSATTTDRMNFDGDTDIDSADHKAMRDAIAKYRIGPFGKLTNGDRNQLNLARTAAPASGGTSAKNIFDFDVDGDVDNSDARSMERIGWTGPFVFATVQLGDWTGSLGGMTVTFDWKTPAGATVFQWTESLNSSGRVSIPAPSNGTFVLSAKPLHWLRKSASVTLSATDVAGIVLSLENGDVDGSGEVDAVDIDATVASFGGSDAMADVDGSGEVDAVDIDIVISHFGSTDQ